MELPATFVKNFHNEDSVKKMPYSKLGKTELHISRIGFGGASLSGNYNEFDEVEAIETIQEAVRIGINYIDTAPFYGQGRSEQIIGKALKDVPRKAYYLSTKVGRYTKDWATMFDYSASKVISGFENSIKLLGVDYIDILVIHDIEFADRKQIIEETLPAVEQLVKSGKVKYLAVSGYPLNPLKEVIEESKIKIDVVLTYSRDTLIDKTLQEFLPYFKQTNIGIINAAPTAMALLTNNGPQPWHPGTASIKQLCNQAAQYCRDRGVELGRLAVYHTLKNTDCHNILVGNNNKELLYSNVGLLTTGLTAKEQEVLNYLYNHFFTLKENLQWEGSEVAQYRNSIAAKNVGEEID